MTATVAPAAGSGTVNFYNGIPSLGSDAGFRNSNHHSYDSSGDAGTNTMQLFFDQTLIDTLAMSVSSYAGEGKNSTTNACDRVYTTEEDGTTLLTLLGSTAAGYSATARMYLPIASAS